MARIPDELIINLTDSDEIVKEKIENLYNFYTNWYNTFDDLLFESKIKPNPNLTLLVKSINDNMESQLTEILRVLYEKKNIKYFTNYNPAETIRLLHQEYYKKEIYKVFSKINNSIINEVGETPFSLNLSTGAAGYQPEILFADPEFITKINNNYTYNYVIAIDPSDDSSFVSEMVPNSYSNDDAPFILKTKEWMKRLLGNGTFTLERIDPICYSLELTNSSGNHTKIFFVKSYFLDINFADFAPAILQSSYSIFNCSQNNFSCMYYISNKFIYDHFNIITSTMGLKWVDNSNTLPYLSSKIGSWIFYVKQYKEHGGTLEKLENEVFPIYVNHPSNIYDLIEKILSPYFKVYNSSTFWSLLGGRRRKFKKTRARKFKRSKKTRRA